MSEDTVISPWKLLWGAAIKLEKAPDQLLIECSEYPAHSVGPRISKHSKPLHANIECESEAFDQNTRVEQSREEKLLIVQRIARYRSGK